MPKGRSAATRLLGDGYGRIVWTLTGDRSRWDGTTPMAIAQMVCWCLLAAAAMLPTAASAGDVGLVEQGRRIFFAETFDGNGRTCGSCHPADNNYTIDPAYIARLPAGDPLLAADFLDDPVLLRKLGLVTVHADGFDRPGLQRGVPTLLGIARSLTPDFGAIGNRVHALGWSGDGVPEGGSLRDFATGAVREHMARTPARIAGVDFRPPTAQELGALAAFMRSLGRRASDELELSEFIGVTFRSPLVDAGRELFNREESGPCALCHRNGTALNEGGFNGMFDIGVQRRRDTPARRLRPDLPAEVTWILNRLLAKNPAQRYQQADELAAELASLAEKLGMQLSSGRTHVAPPTIRRADAPWRRHLPWALPTAALFLIVLALDYSWSPPEPTGLSVLPATPARDLPAGRNGASGRSDATGRNGAATRPTAKPPEGEPSRSAATNATRPAPGAEPRASASSPTTPVKPPESDTAGSVPPTNPSKSSVVPQPAEESPGGAAPTVPDTSAPWLRRFAKSIGAELNLDELKARAAAAANAANDDKTSPAVDSIGTDTTAPTFRDQNTAAVPSAGHEGLLVVSPGNEGQFVYSSLQAACNHAKSGDVIELRFNGRLQEVPITISNSRLTIRAGENFQPVVAFRPEPNPVKYPPSMINVAGGQLRATNVHWELDVPRDLPGDWALFEARRAELLRFEGCSFTIRNASLGQSAYHAGVAFFEIKAPPGAGSMAMPPMGGDDTMVTIDLQNCVARGEATFLRDNDLQPLRLHWSNGLLATSERFLVSAGGPNQPRQQGAAQFNLQHLTLAARSGLALLTNSEDAPYQLLTEINCTNCILAVSPAAPLVDQRGPDAADEYLSRVQWSGDHDAFDALDTFWKIQSGATQSLVRQMDFDQWQQHWASRSKPATNEPVGWLRPLSVDRPFHAQTPADYALDTALGDNPAVAAGANEVDLGLIADELPLLPSGQTATTGVESAPAARPGNGS